MKTIVAIILFFSINTINVFAQETKTIDLTVTFTITKYNKGVIYLALYDSEENHMETSCKSLGTYVKDNNATIKLKGIKKGTYSFSYYHDVNSNKKLDKNFIGIPKEPYGFSNNQAGRFGPPNFEESKIQLTENTKLQLEVK